MAGNPSTNAGVSASKGTSHEETEVRNDFPRNGPSGWYSKAWMSRADQSLRSSIPNTYSSTSSIGTRSPRRLGAPITTASSSSMSS